MLDGLLSAESAPAAPAEATAAAILVSDQEDSDESGGEDCCHPEAPENEGPQASADEATEVAQGPVQQRPRLDVGLPVAGADGAAVDGRGRTRTGVASMFAQHPACKYPWPCACSLCA